MLYMGIQTGPLASLIDETQGCDTEVSVITQLEEREADALDVHILTCALLIAGCGDVEGLNATFGTNGEITYRVTPVAINSVLQVDYNEDMNDQACLLACEGVEQAVIDELGELWEDEGYIGSDLVVAVRTDELMDVALCAASEGGLVVIDEHPGLVVARNIPYALLAHMI